MERDIGRTVVPTVSSVVTIPIVAAYDNVVVLEVTGAVLEIVESGTELAGEG
jgi:hypothetical protein